MVGKILNFQRISRRTLERVQDRTRLLLMTNRKSHTPFRLVPTSMTLDHLESRYAFYCTKHKPFGAKHENVNEDRRILSTKLPLSTTTLSFDAPPQGNPANIRINLILPEGRVIGNVVQ